MSSAKIPTPIVDKNGKKTTVHRRADDKTVGTKRTIPSVVATPKVDENISNLEHVLRNVKGINLTLRHKLLREYNEGTSAAMNDLIDDNERFIAPELLPTLRRLVNDEDAPMVEFGTERGSDALSVPEVKSEPEKWTVTVTIENGRTGRFREWRGSAADREDAIEQARAENPGWDAHNANPAVMGKAVW